MKSLNEFRKKLGIKGGVGSFPLLFHPHLGVTSQLRLRLKLGRTDLLVRADQEKPFEHPIRPSYGCFQK